MNRLILFSLPVVLIALGRLRADFVNFESAHVRPLALSSDGTLLYAVNTPDNRVEIFRVDDDGLHPAGEVVVGLEPVAVAERTAGEIWVVNHLSDSVSVVDLNDPQRAFVKATLQVGDEPRDLVFAGPERSKAFITTAHRGQNRPGDPQLTTPGVGRADVWVFSTADPEAPAHIITLFADTPRALAVSPDGARVYVAAFRSGNRTSVVHELAVTDDAALNLEIGDGFTGLGPAPLPEDFANTTGHEPPETSLIVKFDGEAWRDAAGRDWTPRMRFNLPDKDVFVIDATLDTPAEIGFATGVGTVLFNMAVHPLSGRVYVSNQDARNHIRFEPALTGYIAETQLTTIDFGEIGAPEVVPTPLNPHIDYSVPTGSAEEIAQSLAFPMGMEFSSDGEQLYVAAFSSAKVALLDAAGAVVERIPVGGGPSGLALDEARRRLYVLNRFDQTVSIVDTKKRTQTDVVPLRYDPEPPHVRYGRRFLYDAAHSSGHGDASCATCHVFADLDDLAWDLGDPGGAVEPNATAQPDPGTIPGAPLRPFHPVKGPMTTQSLRGLAGAGVMHWRGDRNGGAGPNVRDEDASFMAFRPAFQGLLGRGTEFRLEDMEAFREFILSVRYPPNPIAGLDGRRTPQEAAGAQVFNSDRGFAIDVFPCGRCHRSPIGTGGGSVNQPWLSQDFKVPHLRNLYQKVGMFGDPRPRIVASPFVLEAAPTPHLGDQVRGFGFRHDGAAPTLMSFLREKAVGRMTIPLLSLNVGDPVDPFGLSSDPQVDQLAAFLFSFDTGLRSHVGQQVTLSSENMDSQLTRYELLRDRRGAEFVAHGLLAGEFRSFLFVRPPTVPSGQIGSFQSNRQSEEIDENNLLNSIRDGSAILTFTVVPRRSGERMALDRDEDGVYDADEIARASDPADPNSLPPPEPVFRRADCNDDGVVDITDAISTLGFLFLGDTLTGCKDACDSNDDGVIDLSDAVSTLRALFLGGRAIALPGPDSCGVDPTEDRLECEGAGADCLK